MKTPEELGLTPEQFENFQLLEQFLRHPLPATTTFNMRFYLMNAAGQERLPNDSMSSECGTTRCALGCGPLAGIPVGPIPLVLELSAALSARHWDAYCSRNFCVPQTKIWDWVFHPQWARVDNTSWGAADRIRWLLEHGCPDNGSQQLWGSEPLCYHPN